MFTGAYAFPGGGFTGALISGYFAANNVIEPQWKHIIRRTVLSAAVLALLFTSPMWLKGLFNLF